MKTFTEWLRYLRNKKIIEQLNDAKNSWCVFSYFDEQPKFTEL